MKIIRDVKAQRDSGECADIMIEAAKDKMLILSSAFDTNTIANATLITAVNLLGAIAFAKYKADNTTKKFAHDQVKKGFDLMWDEYYRQIMKGETE